MWTDFPRLLVESWPGYWSIVSQMSGFLQTEIVRNPLWMTNVFLRTSQNWVGPFSELCWHFCQTSVGMFSPKKWSGIWELQIKNKEHVGLKGGRKILKGCWGKLGQRGGLWRSGIRGKHFTLRIRKIEVFRRLEKEIDYQLMKNR